MDCKLDRSALDWLKRIIKADGRAEDRDAALSRLYRESEKGYSSLEKAKAKLDGQSQRSLRGASFVPLDPESLFHNPYYAFLKSNEKALRATRGFGFSHYEAYQAFLLDEISLGEDFESFSPSGYYRVRVDYPIYRLGMSNWMEVIPHEINTMEKAIGKAHGNVLVIGLGIGYCLFMMAIKEEVRSLTVIEKDAKLIESFSKTLLPLFPNKGKIRILSEDAFSYLPNIPDGSFDYCFADIWRDEVDGLPLYGRLLSYMNKARESDYWIEKSLLHYLRRYAIALLEEQALLGYDDSDYMDAKGQGGVFTRLHLALKGEKIQTTGDIKALLSDSFLREVAKKMFSPQ